MIFLVDLSWKAGSLSRDEYVAPVARIVSAVGHPCREIHFSEVPPSGIADADGIVLCGTALKDNAFTEKIQGLAWIRDAKCPVIGICAGMEAICLVFGGRLRPAAEIGMTDIRVTQPDPLLGEPRTFTAYEVHAFACEPPTGWLVTAVSDTCVQAFRYPDRPVFGVMFHPEVRNDLVVERFCRLCMKP